MADVVVADQRRWQVRVVHDDRDPGVALVQPQPPPVRPVQRLADEPADQEVVRHDQLAAVDRAGAPVPGDRGEGQFGAVGPFVLGVAGREVDVRGGWRRCPGQRRRVVAQQARRADRDTGQVTGDQLRGLLGPGQRAVPDCREPDALQPLPGQPGLLLARLGEEPIVIGLAVPDQVEKSARQWRSFPVSSVVSGAAVAASCSTYLEAGPVTRRAGRWHPGRVPI